ncbi:hypothetical protein FRC16_010338 [Serendipita sp. 398]|nr:hypothetical protein FRC16_010338 [Serendipita sp. 398]
MTDEDDFGRPLPNTSPLFNSLTADLVLSSSNSYHFRVHRAILCEASPIFFAALVNLPPLNSSDPPPVQDLAEDGDTVSILLQYIYPMPNPHVTSLATLRLALSAAQRYEITSAIDEEFSESSHSGSSSHSRSRGHQHHGSGSSPYVRWFATWKAAAIPELKARPRSNVIFDPSFLLSHVKRASRHCAECPPTFMASATQAWLTVLKERVDSLPDTI